MKGACSTLKEEGRPAVTDTTKLSDRGAFSIARIRLACNVRVVGPFFKMDPVPEVFSTSGQQRSNEGARDLGIENGRPALALFDVLACELTVGQIVILGNLVGQPFVHKFIAPKAELFAPGPVFELVSQNLVEAES